MRPSFFCPSFEEGKKNQKNSRFTCYAAMLCLCIGILSRSAIAQTKVTWTYAGPLASPARIAALAVDPHYGTIYAGAPGGGVWKTSDSGTTWTSLFDSKPSLQVCSLAIDPLSTGVIYAGTGDYQSPRPSQGVLRSSDGGVTWTGQARITNRPVCALALDPANSARIFAGSEEGLFISPDAGTTWTKVLASPVTSIAFDGPGIVYAGILGDTSPGAREHNLSLSSDGGLTWTDLPLPKNSSSPTAPVNWVNVTTSGSDVFVAVSYQPTQMSQVDVYKSSTAGTQWSASFGIGQAHPPAAFGFDANGNLYLAGVNLLLSTDRGSTWTTVPATTTDFHAAALTNGRLLLAGEKGFELMGAYVGAVSPLPIAQILGVTIDSGSRILAAGPAGLFGLTPVAGIGPVGRVSAVAGANGAIDIFTAGANQVYNSTNSGLQFVSHTVIAADELRAPYPPIVIDPVVPTSAFVAGRRVYHTTDSGDAWTALSIVDADPTRVVTALAQAPAARSTLFAATACLPEVVLTSCPPISVVWRSTNAGQTWVQQSVVAGYVNKFAIDPRQSTRVYAAIGAFPAGPSHSAGLVPGDLLLSTNAGGVWTSLLGNLPRVPVNTIAIDPTSLPPQFNQPAQTLYAGTDAGVFVSFDAGARWMDISSGLPASPVTDLALLQPDGVLVAGTFGRGVYRTSVTGISPGVIVRPLSQDVSLMSGTKDSIGFTLNNLSMSNTVDWQLNALDSWLNVPQPNGTIRPLASAQIPVDVSAVGLQTGRYVGRLQLTTAFGVQNVTVEAQVTPSAAQMTIAGGNDASGLPGATLPALQVLVLDNNQAPLPDALVIFTITSGGGSLSDRTVTTDASGIASVVLTLPSQPGMVQIVASIGTLAVTFTATAVAAPILLTDSIFDGITFNANTSFGPGTILLIAGQNLASGEAAAAANSLPTSLATTRVLVTIADQDVPLPLFSVAPFRIVALLPFLIAPGRYLLHTELGSIRSNNVEISVAGFDPGIFTASGTGFGPGLFIKDNGSLVTASNPADRGSRVTFYAAGLGAVNPPIAAGEPGATMEPFNRTLQTPQVFFDRYSAAVIYSGLMPGIAGRYQVTVQVPASVSPATNVSVSMTIGGFTSNRVTIPVR